MIEVHLIGYTADLRHVVLDVDATEERGRYRLIVDGDLFATLDDMRLQRWEQGLDVGPWEPTDVQYLDEDLELEDLALEAASSDEDEALVDVDEASVPLDEDWLVEQLSDDTAEDDDLLGDLASHEMAAFSADEVADVAEADDSADFADLGLMDDDEEIDGLLEQLASPHTERLPRVVIVPAPIVEPAPEPVPEPEPVFAEEPVYEPEPSYEPEPEPSYEPEPEPEPAYEPEPEPEPVRAPQPVAEVVESVPAPAEPVERRPAPQPFIGTADSSVAPYPPIRRPVGGGWQEPEPEPEDLADELADDEEAVAGVVDSDVPLMASLPSARRRALAPEQLEVPQDAALTPAQIQAELRAGTSLRVVAQKARTSEAWVQRWLEPIEAERARLIAQAQGLSVLLAEGPSAAPLARAVAIRLRKRGVDPAQATWDAARRADGTWRITCKFTEKGRTRSASWLLPRGGTELRSASELAREVGWVDRKLARAKAN